jgi:hypothetical protein
MVTLPFSLTICFSTLLAHEFYKKKKKVSCPTHFQVKKMVCPSVYRCNQTFGLVFVVQLFCYNLLSLIQAI